MQRPAQKTEAFTLIELLLTIGILMILMSITLVSLNIEGQFKSAREAKRSADVAVILESLSQYFIDEQAETIIPRDNISRHFAAGMYTPKGSTVAISVPPPNIDLCAILVPHYVAALPIDPLLADGNVQSCADYHTGYMVTVTTKGRIIVSAPYAEIQPIIVAR